MNNPKVLQVKKSKSERTYEITDVDLELPNGKEVTWSYTDGPSIVVIVSINKNNQVIMKKEWRLSVQKELLELPGGKIENDEDPKEAAIRELKEEVGVTAGKLEPLDVISLWNYTNVKAHFFLATNIEEGENNPDSDEFISTELISFDQAFEMAQSIGTNAQTLLGLILARKKITNK